ncbi:MAG: PTS sugar transporter subunit IIA [Planctomycetaceae bacterium]
MATGSKRRDRNSLKDLFPHDLVVQHLRGATKEAVIAELLNALVVAGRVPLEREREVRDTILERERVASTGIGNGLAIPHGKTKHADRLGVAVGLSHQGIDFSSFDGNPVRVVVLAVCPPASSPEHLSLMRALATVAKDPDHAERLADSKDRRELLALLERLEA